MSDVSAFGVIHKSSQKAAVKAQRLAMRVKRAGLGDVTTRRARTLLGDRTVKQNYKTVTILGKESVREGRGKAIRALEGAKKFRLEQTPIWRTGERSIKPGRYLRQGKTPHHGLIGTARTQRQKAVPLP